MEIADQLKVIQITSKDETMKTVKISDISDSFGVDK